MGRVTTTEQDLRARAEDVLATLAGQGARLRDDQWTAIRALVVERRRALVVQRTGWGKSAVYFVATALLRARGAGPTVIVSPLLALMRNQIDAADRAGIHARTINSANTEDWEQVYAEVEQGAVDVLLVSPERLNNPDFRDLVLPKLAASAGLVVVDEAHCISDHLDELPGSGIVYTLTVAAAHEVAGLLRDRGYAVAAYSGQTDPAERLQAEQDLLDNKLKALVATSALGMGFDKPDLGFIVNVGAPQS